MSTRIARPVMLVAAAAFTVVAAGSAFAQGQTQTPAAAATGATVNSQVDQKAGEAALKAAPATKATPAVPADPKAGTAAVPAAKATPAVPKADNAAVPATPAAPKAGTAAVPATPSTKVDAPTAGSVKDKATGKAAEKAIKSN